MASAALTSSVVWPCRVHVMGFVQLAASPCTVPRLESLPPTLEVQGRLLSTHLSFLRQLFLLKLSSRLRVTYPGRIEACVTGVQDFGSGVAPRCTTPSSISRVTLAVSHCQARVVFLLDSRPVDSQGQSFYQQFGMKVSLVL